MMDSFLVSGSLNKTTSSLTDVTQANRSSKTPESENILGVIVSTVAGVFGEYLKNGIVSFYY